MYCALTENYKFQGRYYPDFKSTLIEKQFKFPDDIIEKRFRNYKNNPLYGKEKRNVSQPGLLTSNLLLKERKGPEKSSKTNKITLEKKEDDGTKKLHKFNFMSNYRF